MSDWKEIRKLVCKISAHADAGDQWYDADVVRLIDLVKKVAPAPHRRGCSACGSSLPYPDCSECFGRGISEDDDEY